jgi:uroporphyrinogen-III synthase
MSPRVVLNTRPREQAAELSRLLRRARFSVVEAPAIAVVSAWDPLELDTVRQRLAAGAFDWIVLASQNAGRALRSELRHAARQVVCGSATASALNLIEARTLARFSAGAALELLQSSVQPGERVLVPRASEGRDELLEGLRALKVDLEAPVAYTTVPVDEAPRRLRQGGIDVVALCSPSAVATVAPALGGDISVVCLGKTTAEAARERQIRVDAVARQTSMASLVEAIETLMGAPA